MLGVPKTIAQRELRNDNATVMDAVANGETFVVTRNGVPVAEIRPVRGHRRTLVPRAEIVALAAAGPSVDARALRKELDAAMDQSLG